MMMYSKQHLERVRKLAYKHIGITLGPNKDAMVSNRLDKLRDTLNNNNVEELLNSIEQGEYIDTFVATLTTNKTNFFRESYHFDDLRDRIASHVQNNNESLSIYCAAASTGEEPYSIIMTLEHAKELHDSPMFKYSLLASDIDTSVLATSKKGIYEWEKSAMDFPSWITPEKYFKRRENTSRPGDYLIKVKDSLRKKVEFGKMNLMSAKYPFREAQFDVVFCRNVLIYFNQEDQLSILKKLFSTLKIGGTLYLGHAESPLELVPYIERLGHNIFVKTKHYL